MLESGGVPRPRQMTLRDVSAVAELHKVCFEGYFLTGLGDRVLRALYTLAVTDRRTFATVLEDCQTGQLIGLAIGTLNPGFFTQLMRRNFRLFVFALARGVLKEPAVRTGAFRRLGFVKRLLRPVPDHGSTDAGVPEAGGLEASFLDVAVHPDWRGGKHAESLVAYFSDEVFAGGAARLAGSVLPHNLASIILYKRLGWNVRRTGPRRVDVWIDREQHLARHRNDPART
jgi:ribosomal protein S18 acetylase RimI-like enzyme